MWSLLSQHIPNDFLYYHSYNNGFDTEANFRLKKKEDDYAFVVLGSQTGGRPSQGQGEKEPPRANSKAHIPDRPLSLTDGVPKEYLAPEMISHFVMHGTNVAEIVTDDHSFHEK
ncbi:hypothetical protein L6164_010156 [Bauhinia variegata]|uniref:Uncharacterized protein n=1 Tax=Bauhinia variegata TaxID=167791 RepID=A0ACB9PM06_BAUVA|nr:hypothetical protein L6164_010156 [Bauhinia variegata]